MSTLSRQSHRYRLDGQVKIKVFRSAEKCDLWERISEVNEGGMGRRSPITSGEISIQLGISGSDGDAITTEKAGACTGGTTFQNGEWHERTATSTNYNLPGGNCTELAWVFSTATAVPGTTYNLRLYNNTNGYSRPNITRCRCTKPPHSVVERVIVAWGLGWPEGAEGAMGGGGLW